jgi:adenosine kinase
LKIIVTGSIAYDYLMSFPGKFSDHFLPDKLDRISVSFLVDALWKQRGGVAANIAYSLALLDEQPCLFGTAGKDFGPYREELDEVGVDTSEVKVYPEEFTASCFINTDLKGNQIVSFYTGAMRFSEHLSLKDFGNDKIDLAIVSANDPEAMIKYASECQDMSIPFIFDPSQQIVRLDGEALKKGAERARLLIVNEYEFEMFKKKTGLADADVLKLADAVIVTLGDKGSEIQTQEGTILIPIAPPERVLDPTGGGDAFRAGLMKGLVHGLPWEEAGRMGSLAATYVLETEGPQSHSYDLKAFVDRYCRVFGDSEHVRNLTS